MNSWIGSDFIIGVSGGYLSSHATRKGENQVRKEKKSRITRKSADGLHAIFKCD
jgi:hypothetical protein